MELATVVATEYAAGRRGVDISGPYSVATTVQVPPGFTINSPYRDAVCTVPDGIAISSMLDFATLNAQKSRVRGVTLQGNRGTVADDMGCFAALVYDTDDVTIEDCFITKWRGTGVLVRDGRRTKFKNNKIDNVYLIGFAQQSSSPGKRSDAEISGNEISNYGMHAILAVYGSNTIIRNNKIQSYMLSAGLNMALNGSLYASSLSGNYFTSAAEGKFIILAGGWERLITKVLSPVQITLDTPLGPIIRAPASWGNGDVITIQGANDCLVETNELFSGASLGISVFSDTQASADRNHIVGNRILGMGSAGISLQNQVAPTYVRDTLIAFNEIVDAGLNGAAGANIFNVGIALQNNQTFDARVIGNSVTGYSRSMICPILVNAALYPPSTRQIVGNKSRGCINDLSMYATSGGAAYPLPG